MAKVAFPAGRLKGFTCPPDKQQAFLWDATSPGLGMRVTRNGKPTFIFQSVFNGDDVRITIGSPTSWSIKEAQEKARELQRLIDEGKDPRNLKREALALAEAQKQQSQADALKVSDAWAAYLEARRPHWSDRHYQDHLNLSQAGGEKAKNRRKTLTRPGPLHHFMGIPLKDLDSATVEQWAQTEGQTRPTVARLAWRCLKAFLNWCSEEPAYKSITGISNPAKTKKAREALGKAKVKQDALLKEQLPAWFSTVEKLTNPAVTAYFKTLLLTGARPGEILTLRWEDINSKWKGLTIRDKVEGERVIPLTPYVHHLLATLPRRNEWVFASPRSDRPGEHMTRLDPMHSTACKVAGIDGLTLHGLRRSFKSLTEWLEIPVGVVAQIQGHKPSATAEKHYTVRPLDLLRLHHERIEAWMLEQAGVKFDPKIEPGKLQVVA